MLLVQLLVSLAPASVGVDVQHLVVSDVERDQRRRARCRDRADGADEIQDVGHSRARDRRADAQTFVGEVLALRHAKDPAVLDAVPVRAHVAEVDADALTVRGMLGVAGSPQRLVARLQDDALPWIHALGFVFRDSEEGVVEVHEFGLIQKAPVVHVGPALQHGLVPVWLVVDVHIPADAVPLSGAVRARGEHVPVRLVAPAAPGHPHHQRLDVGLIALWLPRPRDVQEVRVALCGAAELAHLGADDATGQPGLQRHAAALRVVAVAHDVVAEEHDTPPGDRQRDLIAEPRHRQQRDLAGLGADEGVAADRATGVSPA
mmetsp:Transcript_50777/g.130872  ORF Transcript_50777/g.130872 Transcript_50777/m.130872 type:complete len:318 (-) Transcript_50777:73-1026(-)